MKNIFKILAIALFTVSANAQVGIGTETPDASAVLDVTSADKGLLLPRLTTVARTGIATPAAGLQVYDTDTNSVWFYNGTIWTEGSGVTGPQGPAGTNGTNGTNGTDGADGDSAYDTWIAAGNTGTEADFLNGITGADGATGPQGPAGTNGTNGVDGAVGPQGPAGDPATDDQDLTLTGNTLAISGDPNTDVDLSAYLDNTDDQTATEVTITDTASNFTATDVEGALAELVTTDSDDAWGVTGEDITSEIKRTGNVIVGGAAQIGGATPKLAVQNNDNPLTTANVTPTELLHLSRAGTEGTKWGANAQFKLGAYSTHPSSRSSLEIALTDINNDTDYNPVMTLNGNGNVGIGTTTPSTKLDVETTLGAGTGLRIKDGSEGTDKILVSDANGNAQWKPINDVGASAAGSLKVSSNIVGPSGSAASVTGNSVTLTKGVYMVEPYNLLLSPTGGPTYSNNYFGVINVVNTTGTISAGRIVKLWDVLINSGDMSYTMPPFILRVMSDTADVALSLEHGNGGTFSLPNNQSRVNATITKIY